MMELLAWIENSGLGVWVRESPSLFAYTGLLAAHGVGLAFAVGLNVALDLRILGFAPQVPMAPLKKVLPVIWLGFWVNAFSGTLLLISSASRSLLNPVFLLKLTLIGLAVWTLTRLQTRVFGRLGPATPGALAASRPLAMASIGWWAAAITAGKLIEYPHLYGVGLR